MQTPPIAVKIQYQSILLIISVATESSYLGSSENGHQTDARVQQKVTDIRIIIIYSSANQICIFVTTTSLLLLLLLMFYSSSGFCPGLLG